MAVNRQKLKLLYLMRMLEEETDAEQGLTMSQILERLEAQGITAERKGIYRDIEALREFGLDVRTYQRAPVEYALERRDFAFHELLLLVDAVQSSRFLTQRKSDALVEAVKRLASARQCALLDKRLHVEGRIKMQNESVFHSVDRIQEAIAQKRQISFVYFKYDAAKEKVLQHGGERYVETPVQLVYAEGYYYLVVFNEKHDDFATYRVDRMDRIKITDAPAVKNERIATFDAQELEGRAFGMYSGESVAATLLVSGEAMGAIIDRFGKDVESLPAGEGWARVYATVMKSPVLFGWLAQFGDRVHIEKPASLAAEYRDYLAGIVASYGE
ncbi:helix-turn-helix transcriptional regulator [Gordonibacter urolithinfaciens]|uniref:WYL domain-containing protein n=1 Tax=Gordonibacter urolithinfaciens TaxID=1335613 RepID=A0A423ULV5_9ACTN|nr:WYL domain-containing protein [Gordonibacter urolithinfaciens]MBS6975218.1 WYL domain-containing protein [Eggerthellaceae bacterium]MCB6561084.1 WYL domain-containing protein [Gordonibacter urolithinfaciens]ROT90803.1 WYL domain-containing protein [Gordonibacter urolithinfaciens]